MLKIYSNSLIKPNKGGATFSLKNRIYRAIWNSVWFLFASWTPPIFRGWRRFLLRMFGARLSSTTGVYGSARIWAPYNLSMDEHSFIGPDVKVYCMAPISFGKYALASQGAYLCAGTHDIYDADFPLYAKPILIGDYAWVAAEAFVGPSVTLGEGAVLGARGCAFRDLEPWTVYAGNPAREIKKRSFAAPDKHAEVNAK